MKKSLVIGILTIFLFGANSVAGVVEDLQNFEQSLGAWVTNIDELNQRLSNLEKNIETKDKQLTDVNQSLSNIEKLLADLNAKVDKVEKMSSVSGVKDILKTYEGTLNVFKKRFSEMAKRLEDQQVKTAVLERIYQTSQKPLETLMTAIDEQKEVVKNIVNRLVEQEKMLLSIEEGFKKQVKPTESLVKSIEDLKVRLSDLESGTIVRKKEEIIEKELEVETKKEVVSLEAPKEEAKVPTEEIPGMKGFTDIGKGFFVKNVEFKPFGSSSYMKGEIMNKSGIDYSTVDFKVQTYNEEDVPLGGHGFSINGFKKGSTKILEEVIVGVEPKKIAKYAIFFAEMPLLSTSGEEAVKVIERKFEVASEIEKGKSTAKKAWETAKELEGFENIGSGFFVRKVSFTSFGSSSTVTGEIKNNSKKDYNLASFIMKIYSKDYGMITGFDFSVRRLKSGDIKTFEEIISGVGLVDIARYEIIFKKSY